MPRKSSRLHAIHGTGRADRLNPHEPEPEPIKDIAAPIWLDSAARAEWDRIAPELQRTGVLADIDAEQLANYCSALSIRNQALADIEENGITLVAVNREGAEVRKKNPACQVLKESLDSMARFGRLFGLSPVSRGSLQVPQRNSTEGESKHQTAMRLLK